MKLYKVTNGFIGYSEVRVLVVAPSEERAIELARAKYKKETESKNSPYGESYYKGLEAECMCENTNEEWSSEVEDY